MTIKGQVLRFYIKRFIGTRSWEGGRSTNSPSQANEREIPKMKL